MQRPWGSEGHRKQHLCRLRGCPRFSFRGSTPKSGFRVLEFGEVFEFFLGEEMEEGLGGQVPSFFFALKVLGFMVEGSFLWCPGISFEGFQGFCF